jgi:hypothetical protein
MVLQHRRNRYNQVGSKRHLCCSVVVAKTIQNTETHGRFYVSIMHYTEVFLKKYKRLRVRPVDLRLGKSADLEVFGNDAEQFYSLNTNMVRYGSADLYLQTPFPNVNHNLRRMHGWGVEPRCITTEPAPATGEFNPLGGGGS